MSITVVDQPSAVGARQRTSRRWRIVVAVEVALATAAVLLDLVVPTLALLLFMAVSLGVRREGLRTLGLRRPARPRRLVASMALFATTWTLVQLAVVMPIANHLAGQRQDLSQFEDLEGNIGMLIGLLVLSWTLAAVGEELAYRGYLQTRVADLMGATRTGLVLAVGMSSLLFGLAHAEQGAVGVLLTTVDAVAFSVVRYRYETLWAAVLAHGFNNTIGFIAFFLAGPTHGLW
jgi:membrane protease YdiL (CAAX protease family)